MPHTCLIWHSLFAMLLPLDKRSLLLKSYFDFAKFVTQQLLRNCTKAQNI